MKNYMYGLGMMDGREVNLRPRAEMGISKLARMKKQMKRYDKVQMMAEAQEMANANINLFKK
jgi:hypothetical protein